MRKHPEEKDPGRLDCRGAEPFVEAYVDGELDKSASTAFEAHVESCAACAAELELARRIHSELRSLPAQECPPGVVTSTFDYAASRPTLGARLAAWLLPVPPRVWQGALAMLVVAALAVGYFQVVPSGPAPADYSAEEVAQAEAELKLALAYLGKIGETVSTTVGTDVLGNRVVGPISQSIAGALMPAPEPKTGGNGGTT